MIKAERNVSAAISPLPKSRVGWKQRKDNAICDRYFVRVGAKVRLYTSRFDTEKAIENYASLGILSINIEQNRAL
jgi:hypothetical protein